MEEEEKDSLLSIGGLTPAGRVAVMMVKCNAMDSNNNMQQRRRKIQAKPGHLN